MKEITNSTNILRQARLRPSISAIIDTIPILIGIAPFGLTCGMLAIAAGLKPWEAIAMSAIVFAGASQFIAITMIAAGTSSLWLIAATTLLINLRHLLMGLSIAPHLLKLPIWQQAMLSFALTDESYSLTASRIEKHGYSASHQFTCSLLLYLTWVISTALGTSLAAYINDPLAWGLDFAMPATFLALLMPRLKNRRDVCAAIAAGSTAVAGAIWLPGNWYIIIACLAACLVGGLWKGEKNED